MKIGLVSPYVYPLPGGVTQHVRYLYENLRLRGHDVRILTSSHGLQRASEGDIIRIGKGFSLPVNGSVGTVTLSPRFVSQVRDTLERERFDLLHFHEPFVPFLSTIILRLSTSVNIATFHAYGGFSPSYEFGSKVMKGEAARLHGRIAVSGAAKHFIDRYFPGEYKVIPNGVDVDRFQRAVPLARWQDGTQNILFVGRFEPRKGLLELLKAYRILRKAGFECRLLVVGTGPLGKEARRYIATRRLRGVEFLGRVSDEEKAQLYRTADVYVSPATGGESFGIVLLEAMAAGTPIVASDIHGYKGVVRRGREALLVPPNEPKPLAAAIGRLLRDDELRAEMGRAGRERAQEFSWERVTAKVDDFYGVIIRRLSARGELPPGFHAPIPPSPRSPAIRLPETIDLVASSSGLLVPRGD
ncbi:MAG TPA: glycosyltransferase family 4 protein [Candidatus Limnocylindrales bacterium]|nr:glycosyltransferase family 4 protein [Candidatus Limnocylindrales bacterium]